MRTSNQFETEEMESIEKSGAVDICMAAREQLTCEEEETEEGE